MKSPILDRGMAKTSLWSWGYPSIGSIWLKPRRCSIRGLIKLVSPLDSASTAELELSEELEGWLEWVVEHKVEHVRLESL